MKKNTKIQGLIGLLLVLLLAGCYGAGAGVVMLINAGMTAGGLMGPTAIDKMANTHQLPWREVRLQMDISGESKDIRALRELAERTLNSRGVKVTPNATHTMRVAESSNGWVGVEVLTPKKISVAEVVVKSKKGYTRGQLLEHAIRNIVILRAEAGTGKVSSGG